MDVQGATFEVLRGFGRRLADIRHIIAEIELMPMYAGAKLFPDVCNHLYDHGFRLRAVDMETREFGNFLFSRG